MSLPACQERILRGMESALRKGEPRLASRFAIFTRLTKDEELPRTEQLVPRPWPWRLLGHASMTTTAIYLDALGEEEREIAARMWATAPAPAPPPHWIDRA